MQKRGLEMTRLDEVIAMLASGDQLDEKYHDHALGGDFYEDCKRDIEFSLTFFYILIFSIEITSSQMVVFACGGGMFLGKHPELPFPCRRPVGNIPGRHAFIRGRLSFSQSAESAHAGERGTDGVQAKQRC